MKKISIFVLMSIFCLPNIMGQKLGIEALCDPNTGYPQLMAKFGNELEQKRADYFFVIDVSGSMNRYQDIVVNALNEFFSSLQDGDYVNVIHFGAEAEVVNGCYGTIDRKKVQSLSSNTNQIYFKEKPSDPSLKERLWNYTDLGNAMHTLANEMHQLGLNDLKFVFIITDFEHDPPSSRRGYEDWDGIRQQFEKEQSQSNVNVITLQLPGNPTHLKQVRDCFPNTFSYQSKAVADGSDLASWFTKLKNNIMLDRFKAIVSRKVQDANLSIVPDVDINGNFNLFVDWKKNELFDSIRVEDLSFSKSDFQVCTSMPLTVVDPTKVKGRFVHVDQSFFPSFRKLDGSIIATATYASTNSLQEELKRLGIKVDSATAYCEVNRTVFSHPWSLGWCVFALLLVLYYLVMIFVSLNWTRTYRIRGIFYVTDNGASVTNHLNVANRKKICIGQQGYTLQVPNCKWDVEIYEKTYPAIVPLLHLKRPQYRVRLKRGMSMTVANRNYRTGVTAPLARSGSVVVDRIYTIHWN